MKISISDSFDYKFKINKNNQILIEKVDDRELALEEIIFFNFVCSLYQGLSLIKKSNVWDFFDYKIDDVFKAWSAGCILQGNYLNFISQRYQTDKTLNFEFLFNLTCFNKKLLND